MDSFIKLSNFGKIAPYAQLFRTGTSGNCTVIPVHRCDRFCARTDPCADAYVKHPSVPRSRSRP